VILPKPAYQQTVTSEMLNKTAPRNFIAPRRQERKGRKVFPNLARFASLREVIFL
jgi:hypothetical protein